VKTNSGVGWVKITLTLFNIRNLILDWAVLISLLVVVSCDGGSTYQKAQREFSNGHYNEAIYIIRHHFKSGGERSPQLLFLEGRALLRLGKETDAENTFAAACSIDTFMAHKVAQIYSDQALESFENGNMEKGKRFLRRALNYGEDIPLGKYDAIAGEMMLGSRRYERAIFYLNRYLQEYKDSTGTAEKMMELAEAYEGMGNIEESINIYRKLLDEYPKSRFNSTAQWNLEKLLYKEAINSYEEGDVLEARNMFMELVSTAGNKLIRGRSLFFLGEISEKEGNREKAIDYYRRIINLNLHSSGRMVEKAKERIEKLGLSPD
jgi:TolA-binding protein